MKKIQIFLSSRFSEFAELREKIIREKFSKLDIGLEVNALDDRGGIADSRSPALASIEEADGSDIFILLLGETYGSIPNGYSKSYTHMEYETALKKGLKILAFPIGDAYVNGEYSKDPMLNKWQKDVLVNNSHITATPYPTTYDIDEVYETIYRSLQEDINRLVLNQLHKKNPPLTSKLGKDNIIGREKELEEIEKLLNSSSSLLLINGIGGVGKSNIASYYLHSKKDSFDYYGFFEGIESFVPELKASLGLKQEKLNDAFMEAIAKLSRLEGKKLIVIDDVKDVEENQDKLERILALKVSGYQILLTSREEIEFVESYYLDILTMADAKLLFRSLYKFDIEDVLLEEILGYLDCHSLFVEMTAKALQNRKKLTPKHLKEKFDIGEFTQINLKRKKSFRSYLKELFSFDELDEDEVLILKQLSVLPSIEIEFDFLEKVLQKEEDEEFEEILNYLVERGWLIQSSSSYKLHQIIKEYIFDIHLPSFINIEDVLNYYLTLITNSFDPKIAVDNRDNLIFLDTFWQSLKKICEENELVAKFFNCLANIYHHLGIYDKAESLYTQALVIRKKVWGEEHVDIASSYNDLALLYHLMGMYKKAELFYANALLIREKILGKKHLDTATSYNNLALLCESIGTSDKAEYLYKKALAIRKNILGDKHTYTAQSYHNLAGLYRSMRGYKKAECLYKKALAIYEKEFGEEHPNTAFPYNSLGVLYQLMELYEKAELFHLKALKIRKKFLGKKHPSTATSYHNLAELYHSMDTYKNVESLHLKALKIREKFLGKNHPDTAQSYNSLAIFYYSQKQYLRAYEYIKKTIEVRLKVLPNRHPDLIDSQKWMDRIKGKVGL